MFNPRPLRPEEYAPISTGINKNFDSMIARQLQNIQMQRQMAELPYVARGLEAKISGEEIENALNQPKVPLAKQLAEAGLAQAQALPEHTRASTQHMRTEDKFTPLKYLIQAQNSQRSSSRFGPTYEMARALSQMPETARNVWIEQNQEAYTNMLTDLANAQRESQTNKSQGILTNELLSQFFPGLNNQNNNQSFALPSDQINKLMQPNNPIGATLGNAQQNSIPSQNLPIADQLKNVAEAPQQLKTQTDNSIKGLEKTQEFKNATSEQKDQMKNTLQMNANNKLVTAAMKNRRDNAVAMDLWLIRNQDEYAPRLKRISQYAGIVGKGIKSLDQLQAETPEAYEDLQWFTGTFIPNLDNQVKLMEKMGATDSQRKELTDMLGASVQNWTISPKASIRLLNKTIRTMGQIGNSVMDASEPIYKGVTKRMHGLKEIPEDYIPMEKQNFDQKKIEHTAKKYGISEDEVKRKLGIQ